MLTRGQKNKEEALKKITCLICLLPCLENKVTVCCSGCYHSECIAEWYKINKACPICKNELNMDDIMDEDYQIQSEGESK